MDELKKLIRITISLVSAVLILTIFGFYYISIKAEQDDLREDIEKVAERQQLLSQQILKNVLLVLGEHNTHDSLAARELRKSLQLFKEQQQFLEENIATASPANRKEIRHLEEIIRQTKPYYNTILNTGYNTLRRDSRSDLYSETLARQINRSELEFLKKLNSISIIARNNQDVLGVQIYWLNVAVFGSLIIALIVLAFLVITPIFKNSIRDYQQLLDAKNKAELAEIERTKMVSDLILRNRDLEQFAYIVSHNLRAPVANITGTLDVLDMPGLTTEERNIFTTDLRSSVGGLDEVIKDLNQILQIKLDIDETKTTVNFSKLVEDIKTRAANLISKDISITYDFSEVASMSALPSYLYSIFYNLIINSIKYRRPQTQALIKIQSFKRADKVILIFRDNGMGIDLSDKTEQIFGLYKRFHPNIEGKGVGLFLVKTQVETLGGIISVKSSVNEGTEFKIVFQNEQDQN